MATRFATSLARQAATLLAASLVLVGLAACAPQPTKPSSPGIPPALYERAERACFDYVGFAFETGDTWSYTRGRIVVVGADGTERAEYFAGMFGTSESDRVVSCLQGLPPEVGPWPTSPDSRLQLVHYAREVLWPCLRTRGYDPGDPPRVADF